MNKEIVKEIEKKACYRKIPVARKKFMQSDDVIDKFRLETDIIKRKEMRVGEARVQRVPKRNAKDIVSFPSNMTEKTNFWIIA